MSAAKEKLPPGFYKTTFMIGLGFFTLGSSLSLRHVLGGGEHKQLSPPLEKANLGTMGAYTGIYYVFSQGAAIVTPPVTGLIVDALGFRSMFGFASILMLASYLVIGHVRGGEPKRPARDRAPAAEGRRKAYGKEGVAEERAPQHRGVTLNQINLTNPSRSEHLRGARSRCVGRLHGSSHSTVKLSGMPPVPRTVCFFSMRNL